MNKEFVFDKEEHVYTLDGKPLHGVTSVLNVIAKPMLIGWAAREAVGHVRLHQDIDWNDKEVVEAMLKDAENAHKNKKNKAASQGTDTHAAVEIYVKECIQNGGFAMAATGDEGPALASFIKWALENSITFLESEKQMFSEEWWVAGTADLVFERDGKRYIGDLKTMKKLWDIVPFIQCAAYGKMLTEQGYAFDGTCVINIPKETNEVEAYYRYDLEGDTKAFEAALYLYKALKQ